MKTFNKLDYANEAEMYFCKAEYYQKLFHRCVDSLIDSEDWRFDEETNNYYSVHCGSFIDEGL